MVQRLLQRHLVEVEVGVSPERPAARRENQAAHAVAALAPEALPDRAVLGVDGPDPPLTSCLHHQRSGHDEDFLGRQRELLPRFQGGKGGRKRASAGYGDDDKVAPRVGDHRLDPCVEVGLPCLALDEVLGRAFRRPASFSQAEQLEPGRVAVDDVERLLPDGSRSAEDGNVDRTRH